MSLGYYRLGQSYPRTARRQSYPPKRRYHPFSLRKVQIVNETISFTETIGDTNSRTSGGLDTFVLFETLSYTPIHIRNITDTLTIVQTQTKNHVWNLSRSQTIAFTDHVVETQTHAFPEALTFIESTTFQGKYKRTVPDTLVLAESKLLNATRPRSISDNLTFTQTAGHQRVQSRSLTDTLTFIQFVKYGQFINDSLTFSETIAKQAKFNLSRSQTLTFAETLVRSRVQSRTILDAMAFTDVATARKVNSRSINQDIVLSDAIKPQYVRNRHDTMSFTNTVGMNAVFTRSITDSLTYIDEATGRGPKVRDIVEDPFEFIENIHKVYVQSRNPTDTLTIADTVGYIKSKGFYDTLTLTETVVEKKVVKRSLASTISFTDLAASKHIAKRTATDAISFTQAVSYLKRRGKEIDDILTFTDHLSFTKVKGFRDSLVFSEHIVNTRFRKIPIVVHDSLVLTDAMSRRNRILRSIHDALDFSALEHKIPIRLGEGADSQGQIFTFPIAQVTVVRPVVILQGPNAAIVLPRPEFGDTESSTDKLNLLRSMTGKIFTYRKTSDRQRLVYNFTLTRYKALELRQFILRQSNNYIILTNWKGQVWVVKLTNNPFEFAFKEHTKNDFGRITVGLEFEGIKVSG